MSDHVPDDQPEHQSPHQPDRPPDVDAAHIPAPRPPLDDQPGIRVPPPQHPPQNQGGARLENGLVEPEFRYDQTWIRGKRRRYNGFVERVSGPEGERLREDLAAAIRDLLDWATQHTETPTVHPNNTGTSRDHTDGSGSAQDEESGSDSGEDGDTR